MTSIIKNESNRGRGHARTVTKFWNPRIKFCPLICLHRRKTMPVVNDGGDLGQRARHRPTCRRLLPHSQERHVSSMLQTLSFPPLSRPRRHHKMIGRATQRGRRHGTVGGIKVGGREAWDCGHPPRTMVVTHVNWRRRGGAEWWL